MQVSTKAQACCHPRIVSTRISGCLDSMSKSNDVSDKTTLLAFFWTRATPFGRCNPREVKMVVLQFWRCMAKTLEALLSKKNGMDHEDDAKEVEAS